MNTVTVSNIIFHDDLADTAASISDAEWAYFDYADSVSDQIAAYMEQHGISKAELARRMGTSRAYITKVLAGDANMTMKTLATLLHHLGARPTTRIVGRESKVRWFNKYSGAKSFTLKSASPCQPDWRAAASQVAPKIRAA